MKILYFFVLFIAFGSGSRSQDITGDWHGELKFAGNTLKINYKIEKSDEGLTSYMSIPQQGIDDFKADATSYEDSIFRQEFEKFGVQYQGEWSSGDTIFGEFSQNGLNLKLNLIRGSILPNRPQEPRPPFEYYTEDVKFMNEKDGISFGGTLTLPKKDGQFPVLILLSGSGPQDRNSSVFGHKPFLLLADELTKTGVGVLRFDERGVGESEGEFFSATLDDFIEDARAAYLYLKSRPEIDQDKIGLLGHSIGGVIAPKLAINEDVSFLILLAAPGVGGDELLLKQRADLLKMRGVSDDRVEKSNAMLERSYNFINNSSAVGDELRKKLKAFFDENYVSIPAKEREVIVEQLTSNEILGLVRTKPKSYLSKINCPVLAVGGTNDFQVSSSENLKGIQLALKDGGNTNVEVHEFEGLNHLFQESETGDSTEYSEIEQTMSPKVLEVIKEWVKRIVKE